MRYLELLNQEREMILRQQQKTVPLVLQQDRLIPLIMGLQNYSKETQLDDKLLKAEYQKVVLLEILLKTGSILNRSF